MTSDLVVVGAGTMGAWTALHARRAGVPTTLVDTWGAGNAQATSGDETRIIRSSHGPDELYTRWSRRAREEWIAFGDDIGQSLFVPAGMLWFGHRSDGREAASEATLRRLGIPVERLSPDEAHQRWPQIATDDLAFALFEPEAGLIMARRGIEAVASAFAAAGGRPEIGAARPGAVDGRRLRDIVLEGGRRLAGETFVFAAGPWLPGLFPTLLGARIAVTRQDVYFVGPRAGDARFGPDTQPCWVDYDRSFYGIPNVEARGVKAAHDQDGPPFDPTNDERVTSAKTAALTRAYLGTRFPDLANQPIIASRVCQYESTPDTHFIIDRHPDLDNVWVVGGGSGHGFKHGPVIGRYVTRLLGFDDGEGIDVPDDGDDRFLLSRERNHDLNMRTGSGTSGPGT